MKDGLPATRVQHQGTTRIGAGTGFIFTESMTQHVTHNCDGTHRKMKEQLGLC